MDLRSAETDDDLVKIYQDNNLTTPKDKISFLRKTMKIRATRCDVPYTDDEELTSLQELALSKLW